MPQGKHIRAPKHYSEPQGVWVAQKSTFHRIPEGFFLQYGSYQWAQRWIYINTKCFRALFKKNSLLSNDLVILTLETQKTHLKLSELFFSCKNHQNSSF